MQGAARGPEKARGAWAAGLAFYDQCEKNH